MPSGTGPLSPDFTGIDPDLMRGFVTALERGRDVIGEQSERIRLLLATAQMSAAGVQPIKEIEGWIGDELPRLRERLQTINQDLPMLEGTLGLPGQVAGRTGEQVREPVEWGLLPYDEKTGKSPAGSAKEGTELANQFARLPPSPLGLPTAAYDRILDKLAHGQKDAYLTAGFFRIIGPKGMLGMIHRLERYDRKAAAKHRQAIGNALGTAVGAQPGLLGPAWKAGDLKKASDDVLASLLQYGMFPAASNRETRSLGRSRSGSSPMGWTARTNLRWDVYPVLWQTGSRFATSEGRNEAWLSTVSSGIRKALGLAPDPVLSVTRRLQDNHRLVFVVGEPDRGIPSVFGNPVRSHSGERPKQEIV